MPTNKLSSAYSVNKWLREVNMMTLIASRIMDRYKNKYENNFFFSEQKIVKH
jgi:hypothetical protein